MQLEHVPCDLCGSTSYGVRYRKPDNWLRSTLFEFPVVECDGCSLVYVNPRPTMAAMAGLYPDGYHDGRDGACHSGPRLPAASSSAGRSATMVSVALWAATVAPSARASRNGC